MISYLAGVTDLATRDLILICSIVFLAGLVRGFAGFALSAILMAGAAVIIAPIELIPVAYLLESSASIVMFRGGLRHADMSVVWPLAIGSAIGAPLGLFATTSISPDASRMVALCLVLGLTSLQLFKLAPAFLASRKGPWIAGISAGLASGLANIGGMVVALFVLSSQAEAKEMRGALVMYLFIAMFTSLFWLVSYGIMSDVALRRGIVFAPIVLVGVAIGSALFRPSLAVFYKQFCLCLLVILSLVGLIQML